MIHSKWKNKMPENNKNTSENIGKLREMEKSLDA